MTYNYWDRYDQHEHVRPADMLDDAQAERMREFIAGVEAQAKKGDPPIKLIELLREVLKDYDAMNPRVLH
jgi:hypothetical protein